MRAFRCSFMKVIKGKPRVYHVKYIGARSAEEAARKYLSLAPYYMKTGVYYIKVAGDERRFEDAMH